MARETSQPPVRPVVLIITGPPASGKTTIGRPLAAALGLPYFSKDMLKESLFDSLGSLDRDWSRRVGSASMQLLYLCAETLLEARQSFALECNFYEQWDTPQLRELGERFECQFVQVVCSADSATLVDRFTRRARSGERHAGHVDVASLDELLPRLVHERWDALDLDCSVLRVDTTGGAVDIEDLVRSLTALIGR